jgi:hypothetical protein
VLLPSYGPPSVLRLADDVPLPALGAHDVLVRVAAAGVNPLDCRVRLPPAVSSRSRAQMRAGYARSVFGHLLPLILGREFWRVPPRAQGGAGALRLRSGTVVAAGAALHLHQQLRLQPPACLVLAVAALVSWAVALQQALPRLLAGGTGGPVLIVIGAVARRAQDLRWTREMARIELAARRA